MSRRRQRHLQGQGEGPALRVVGRDGPHKTRPIGSAPASMGRRIVATGIAKRPPWWRAPPGPATDPKGRRRRAHRAGRQIPRSAVSREIPITNRRPLSMNGDDLARPDSSAPAGRVKPAKVFHGLRFAPPVATVHRPRRGRRESDAQVLRKSERKILCDGVRRGSSSNERGVPQARTAAGAPVDDVAVDGVDFIVDATEPAAAERSFTTPASNPE